MELVSILNLSAGCFWLDCSRISVSLMILDYQSLIDLVSGSTMGKVFDTFYYCSPMSSSFLALLVHFLSFCLKLQMRQWTDSMDDWLQVNLYWLLNGLLQPLSSSLAIDAFFERQELAGMTWYYSRLSTFLPPLLQSLASACIHLSISRCWHFLVYWDLNKMGRLK